MDTVLLGLYDRGIPVRKLGVQTPPRTFCRRALSRAKTPIASETLASQIAKRCFYRANALTEKERSGIEVRLKAQRKGVQKQKGE